MTLSNQVNQINWDTIISLTLLLKVKKKRLEISTTIDFKSPHHLEDITIFKRFTVNKNKLNGSKTHKVRYTSLVFINIYPSHSPET